MKKLTRKKLSELIKTELKKAMDEEILLDPPEPDDPNYHRFHNREDDYEEETPYVFESSCGSKMDHDNMSDFATPGEAVGIGYHIGKHHKSGAYMAKKQLYKVAKYAARLYELIPDGHNLEDWMRTKLSQISDDISEVYHALDHDHFEGEI